MRLAIPGDREAEQPLEAKRARGQPVPVPNQLVGDHHHSGPNLRDQVQRLGEDPLVLDWRDREPKTGYHQAGAGDPLLARPIGAAALPQ